MEIRNGNLTWANVMGTMSYWVNECHMKSAALQYSVWTYRAVGFNRSSVRPAGVAQYHTVTSHTHLSSVPWPCFVYL